MDLPVLLRIDSCGVCIYALRDSTGVVLIDSGFLGTRGALLKAMRKAGWDKAEIKGVILTHGHLDHTLNAAHFAREFGAWVAAPEADRLHVEGSYPYRGAARVCGWMEAVGRRVLRYKVPVDVRWYQAGHRFEHWGGLEAVGLPGHTAGHCGLLSASRRLLFCGDLFASYRWSTHLPPAILNTDGERIRQSVREALELEIDGVLPAHSYQAPPEEHLRRLRAWLKSVKRGEGDALRGASLALEPGDVGLGASRE